MPIDVSALGTQYPSQGADRSVLRSLAEYGFRILIMWYATGENLSRSEDAILALLDLTYHGGLMVPLASANPYYSFVPSDPPLPSASAYCEYLTKLYSTLKHYDADLLPLNELANLATKGGWHKYPVVPRYLKIFIKADGTVGIYRQTPARAIPWIDISTLARLKDNEPETSLARFIGERFSWRSNSLCRDCQWRDVCGGIDYFDPLHSIPESAFDAMCLHRKLFLEHFASSRVSDFSLQTSVLEP